MSNYFKVLIILLFLIKCREELIHSGKLNSIIIRDVIKHSDNNTQKQTKDKIPVYCIKFNLKEDKIVFIDYREKKYEFKIKLIKKYLYEILNEKYQNLYFYLELREKEHYNFILLKALKSIDLNIDETDNEKYFSTIIPKTKYRDTLGECIDEIKNEYRLVFEREEFYRKIKEKKIQSCIYPELAEEYPGPKRQEEFRIKSKLFEEECNKCKEKRGEFKYSSEKKNYVCE